ncbi:MAG: hypothetical protein A3F46_10900 [Legionellales bacterium RIFCSPHIGHO2_12_FULL_42_9]|nr:MAG: hypothetical protein A3F46_10900 [Legionellales bacterium RIFCSPHIGHO2_12_FULL_42_9]
MGGVGNNALTSIQFELTKVISVMILISENEMIPVADREFTAIFCRMALNVGKLCYTIDWIKLSNIDLEASEKK